MTIQEKLTNLKEVIKTCEDPRLLAAYAALIKTYEKKLGVEEPKENTPVEETKTEIETNTEFFVCPNCSKVCSSKAGLSSHLRVHEDTADKN